MARDFCARNNVQSRMVKKEHILQALLLPTVRRKHFRELQQGYFESSYKHAKDVLMSRSPPKYNWGMAKAA